MKEDGDDTISGHNRIVIGRIVEESSKVYSSSRFPEDDDWQGSWVNCRGGIGILKSVGSF